MFYEINVQFYTKEAAELAKEIILKNFNDEELMGVSKIHEKK